MQTNGLADSDADHLVCNLVSIGNSEESPKTYSFHCYDLHLSPSCVSPELIYVQENRLETVSIEV